MRASCASLTIIFSLIALTSGRAGVLSLSLSSSNVVLGNFNVSWRAGPYQTHFDVEMRLDRTTTSDNVWFAIGFNKHQAEINYANLVVCKALENEEDSTIEHYINIGDVNSLLDPHMASVGLSDPKILASESSVRCSFRRANKQPQIRNYVTFEPDTRFYMIAVFGQVTVNPMFGDLVIMQHYGKNKFISNLLVLGSPSRSEQEIQDELAFGLLEPSSFNVALESVNSDPDRPKSIVDNAFFKLFYTESATTVDFVISTAVLAHDNVWTAFALSDDEQMGNDNICLCRYANTSNAAVEHYYSVDKSMPKLLDANYPSLGIYNSSVSLVDGVLRCSFSRLKKNPGSVNYFNLDNEHYILMAAGEIDRHGRIRKHLNRIVSDGKWQSTYQGKPPTSTSTSTTSSSSNNTPPTRQNYTKRVDKKKPVLNLPNFSHMLQKLENNMASWFDNLISI